MAQTSTKAPEYAQQLLDTRQISVVTHCSRRHILRMADEGRMPAPVRLGALVRWPKHVIDEWIRAGCPNMKATVAARGQKEVSRG